LLQFVWLFLTVGWMQVKPDAGVEPAMCWSVCLVGVNQEMIEWRLFGLHMIPSPAKRKLGLHWYRRQFIVRFWDLPVAFPFPQHNSIML
jgi:hypothetical protein